MESPFMSYSLKVQIIRSLDMTTFFVDGIQWLLGSHSKQLIQAENAQSNCLQRILSLMLKKQVSHCTGLKQPQLKITIYHSARSN